MYDSINPARIPANAAMVAGYVDGIYGPEHGRFNQPGWDLAAWARFPNAVKVRIAVFASTNDGHVLDVETYDATPAQAPGWVKMRRAAGRDPSVYMNASTWPAVRQAFRSAGVPEPHYWVASYPGGGAVIPAGAIAHQYADPGPYDLSVVADFWPGVDSGAFGNPASHLEEDMSRYYRAAAAPDDTTKVYEIAGNTKRWISAAEYLALGSPPVITVPDPVLDGMLDVQTLQDFIAKAPTPATAPVEAPEPKMPTTLTITGPITGTLS